MPPAPMQASLIIEDQTYLWDPARFFDLSLPGSFEHGTAEAFGLPQPRLEALPIPGIQCVTVHDLNPHTTTHLESARHLREAAPPIGRLLDRFHYPCTLLSLEPAVTSNGDRVVGAEMIGRLLPERGPFLEAVILRTLPNGPDKIRRRYTGTNPPYLEPDAAGLLRERGVRVLLVDLPSLDREEDGGALRAHRAFLGYSGPRVSPGAVGSNTPAGSNTSLHPPSPVDHPTPAPHDPATTSSELRDQLPIPRAICELIYAPPELPDGFGLLHLVPLPWELDASPVRPIFHPLERTA